MNKELEQLYAQYSQVNDISRDVFLNSYEQFGDIYINFIQEALKKKENSQETPNSSSGLGENQPTPISAQGNPQITSVPISQDLDLNQSQIEAMQGVQNPASLNLELPQQSVNQNGLLESNGEVNTSSSVLEEFNKNIQNGINEVSDFVQDQITNPNNASLRVLPRKYENQFNNVTQTTPKEEVGKVALPKKSRIELATFETNGLQEIPIPTKSISDELGNVVAKINNDVVKAYKTPSGQTILQTGVGLIPEEVYLSLKDKEGKQRTPQSKDVYENINGVFVEQDYSEVPIDETIKSFKNYDYISSKNFGGKDMAGNPITKEQEKNLYLGLQSKGLGTLEFHEDGTPKFKINKDTAYILDSIFLSDINDGIKYRNRLKNNAYISSVYEGAELEKNARENFIARYGKANYDKYGVLPPQVMDRLQYEERVQNYVSQGYTEQEAVQYANTYRERELQGVREENNFILNNIFSKLKSEDSQEKTAWSTFAENYPKEFRDFFNEYTEKFGDEAWDNSYLLKRFDNPMRRASIKDEFINYIKTLQVYSQIELKNKEKQAKADVRFGAENKNADLINQGYAKLNNLNIVSKFIQGENNAITTLEDKTKPLFKQAYEKGIENAKLESSANRDEFLGVLELGAKKIGNLPVKVIGNLFQSATSFFTGNSDWSKYVNEDIEFSKNAFELNKNAEELRTEVITYKDKQGNIYKLRDGNIYKVDKNGYEFYKPELDNNAFKSNLTEVSRDKEWNITSVTAQGAQLIAEVYLMNRLGTSSGNLMSKPFGSYAVRIAKELGTESRYYNILKSAYKGIRASENASPFGMAAYTFGGMTKRNNDLGYDGLESWFKGMFDSGMMYAANRFFPDARFFKDGDKVQKTAFNLLKNGDKKGALELTKNFFIDASYYSKSSLPDVGGEMFQEMGLEPLFQGVSDVVSGAFKQDKKIWEKAIDPNNFVDLSPETALLTALSTGTIKGVQNLKTSPLASFEGMTDLEKVILSTNMEGLPDALRFISSDASFAGFTGSKAKRRLLEMQTAKKYLDQLPKDNTLTLSQTADVITNLQKLDNLKKEQEKATSEAVKKQYQEQINTVEEAIAKKFEESKNNTIVDEQPQQTTQPEQTQETAQGQTTETNLQPEQGTIATEQSVSADVEANQTLPTNETKQTTKPQQPNVGNTQTPEIIGNQTNETTISEEEQVKINLERLNAYIEAKKQREQEQQAQVSPSAEMGDVQQNEAFSVNEQPQTIEQPSVDKIDFDSWEKTDNIIRVDSDNEIILTELKTPNNTIIVINEPNYTTKGLLQDVIPPKYSVQIPFIDNKDNIDLIKKYKGNAEESWKSGEIYAEFDKLKDAYTFSQSEEVLKLKNKTSNQQPSEIQKTPLVKDLIYFENLAKDYQSFDDFYNDVSKMTDISPEVSNEFRDKYKNENNDTAKNALLNLYNAQKNTQQQEQKVETPKVELQPNQTQIADNVIATIDNITLPDGENGFKVTVSDIQGNLIEDKRGDSEFEFSTQEDVDKFINQKQRGYKLEPRKNIKQEDQVSPSPQYEGAVTYTQFGEGQEGTIYYENGVAKIKDKAGKVYNANSPLVKNLKDADGNAIQLQKGNQRLTPITKQAFYALVTKLQKAFPRFAKVTYDFEAFKKQAEKLGATFNDIQRMVMAFHGSPHSFDKFSTEFMGTGEGAQRFGWGLYFTDLKEIAENYADKLANNYFDLTTNDLKDYFKKGNIVPSYAGQDKVLNFIENGKYGTWEVEVVSVDTNGNTIGRPRTHSTTPSPDRFEKVTGRKPNRNLYQVSLHKGKTPDQYTWLEWDKPLNETQIDKILSNEELFKVLRENSASGSWTKDEVKSELLNSNTTGENLYKFLNRNLTYPDGNNTVIQSTQKDVSLELLKSGIDGVKYPAESISRGATSDNARGFNYVVFDENAITIEDKIQFMQTPNGIIYGAKLPDGTIYLNPQFLNANTPIHEFSHLFEQLLPSRFKKGVELLKQTNLGKKLFEQLKQEGNYANLTDEQLWSEALNTHIGNFGENEVNNTKGKLKQLQDWIKDFFAKVGDVLGVKKLSPDTELRMFTEGVVKDLLGGKPIVAENQVSPSEQVQYSFLTENDYDTNGNIKPEVLAEIQAEREAIKSEAQANGTFMKAPNGNATNLNEAQWIDVRTKRFKDWFGDWENDAKNASKVVDENGEPMVVYHGTKDNFNEFDLDKVGKNGLALGKAFYFTNSPEIANSFGEVKSFYLKLNGEISNKSKTISKADVIKIITELEKYDEYFLSNYGDVQTEGRSSVLNNAIDDIYNYSDNDIDIINSIFNVGGVDREIVSKTIFDVTGKNGIIVNADITAMNATENEIVYAVITPNQIKSATANIGTYSANNNDIRYSINSTTPLSVKEQTEVINELVSNGEESAFAKLQETNWYKGLSNSQKQNINTSNIAETVVNAVNANKRNLEQKVERREEKIESIKDRNYWRKQALNSIKLILNDKTINDKITPNEINRLIKLSEKLNTVKDIDKYFDEFGEKVDKIIEDAEKRLSTKEKLQAQKEELKAKAEEKIDAIKSVKEVIQQTINDASERGLFKGITSSKVLEYAMRNINKAITPAQQKRVLNTVKKIINDNEYLNKVRNANDLAKRVKKVANSKSISKPLVNIDTAKEFAKINPRNVENIDDYIELANAIIGNLKGISVNNKLEVSNKNYGTDNESILKYIEDTIKYNENIKEEELKADYDELLRTSTLPVKDMTFDEYKDFINLSKLEENAQKFENNSKATQEERTNLLRATVNRRLKNDFETEILANKSEYSSEEQKIINRISKIDTSKLDYKQLVKLNDVINNVIYNNSFMDAGNISLIAQVQENEKAIDDFKVKNNFNFLSLSDNWATRALQGAISNDMLVEFITNSTTASAFLKRKSGISAVMDGHAVAKVIQQKTVNAFINMKKKVGWKSDTTENRNIRGIYAEMLRNNGGTDEEIQSEWDRKKGLIEQTIEGLANSSNKDDNKASELLQKVYNKTLKDANNISELEANISKLEFGKFNIDSVKFWIEQHDKYADDFIEQGNIYNNKNLEKELNYTGRKYRPITKDAQKKQDDTLFNEVYRSTEISYKESGSKTKTVKNKFLPKGLVLDLDFDKVQAKMLYDNLYDLKTAEGISLLKNFLSNPENIDRIGGTRNMEALKNMMRNTILAQKQALPFENDNFAKALDKIAGSVMMKSARLALGSVTQLPKQYLSVLVNTSVNLGTDIPLLFEAYRVSGFRNNLELFDKFNIGLRGSTIAGYNKENAIFADENAGAVDKTKAILYDVNKASKALYDGTMKALELSDVSIARTTWLALYMKSLKKQGIDITKIDWSKEHENPNQEAAAFAEQTVSRLQNANDASSMADNFKNTNTYAKVFKNLYMPYSTFAVNQRARMTSDMQKIIHGSIDGRAEAFKSLIATIAEQAVFNSFKIYVLGNGAQYLAELFLTGILGWDDDEAEDLFKNAKKYAKQKFVTSTVSDILFSGMGSATQTGLQLATNKLTKLINGNEYFYEYKNDPEKTGIPSSISALGAYGTSVSTFLGLANDMKYLDGEGEEIVKGGSKNNLVMRPKELSKESKQLVYLTFMIDGLALAGLGDQYISQINQKIKKARDKKIKDDLGSYFDTRIYIPSSSDNYKNYAKLRIDKKTSISDIKQMAKKEGAYLNEKTFSRKMKDEIFNYKISKHRDTIEDKLLKYREGKINRDQLRNYVKSLKDLSYDQQVKLWKTFPKDNKK